MGSAASIRTHWQNPYQQGVDLRAAVNPGAGNQPQQARVRKGYFKKVTALYDGGRTHTYELFLQLEGIEHRTTKVRRPRSNGFIERLHRTLLDEHFRIKGWTT
jgi:transposase InsO family protein